MVSTRLIFEERKFPNGWGSSFRHPDVNRLNGGFGGTKLRPNRVGFSAGCPPVIGVKSDPCRKFNFRFSRPAVW